MPTEQDATEFVRLKFKSVFSGKIGLLKDYKVSINIDKTVAPVQLPVRRAPYHLRKAIESAEQVEQGIIEPVEGPIRWLVPLVPVAKNGDPTNLRLTTDSRVSNKAIIHEKRQMPTPNDVSAERIGMVQYTGYEQSVPSIRAG